MNLAQEVSLRKASVSDLEELSRSGVTDFDIIAVSNKVDYYKKFDFNATEEILCYDRAADQAMANGSGPASACCRAVDLHDLEETGALSMLESSTCCSLGQFTSERLLRKRSLKRYYGNTPGTQ